MRIVTALSSYCARPQEAIQFHEALVNELSGAVIGMALIDRLESRALATWLHLGIRRNLLQNSPMRSAKRLEEFYAWQGMPVMHFPSLNDASLARWMRRAQTTVLLCIDLWEPPKVDLLTSVGLCARVTLSPGPLSRYLTQIPYLTGRNGLRSEPASAYQDQLRMSALSAVPHEAQLLLELDLPTSRGAGYSMAGTMIAAHLNGMSRSSEENRGVQDSGSLHTQNYQQNLMGRP
jgi:hypothetical protein